MNKLVSFLRDESGASAAEYALILAIVGSAIVTAAIFLSGSIANAMNKAGTCVASGTVTACGTAAAAPAPAGP